mmetsp:Transcript_92391/g.239227  ORF Transcript_92391/g.239227 Transcript_92391/m.239227 type:complete len:209 (-) Transcript_92391:258-884(-)
MRGKSATATSHKVEQPVLGVVVQVVREDVGILIVAAHGIRQPCIRVDMAPPRVHVAQHLVELLHLCRTECAIDAHGEGLCVLDADVECLDGLARKRATAVVHNGGAEHHGQALLLCALEVLIHCENGRLGVLRVEDRLNHQQVNPAVNQATNLLHVRLHQLIPSDVAERWVLHAWGHRQGAACRTHGPRHKARLVRLRLGHLSRGLLR